MGILVATGTEVLIVDATAGTVDRAGGLEGQAPTCLSVDRGARGRAWCGTAKNGVFRSDDGGKTWLSAGLDGERVMAVAVSPSDGAVVWVGTEPSALWHTADGGLTWHPRPRLQELPSASVLACCSRWAAIRSESSRKRS